jgi:ppGpp synthetase/RelA/SpoT-type nucleotidyltranferase
MSPQTVVSSSQDPQPRVQEALAVYAEMRHELGLFMDGVAKWFSTHPGMSEGKLPLVHTVKSRFKDQDHLCDKFQRKFFVDGDLSFEPRDLGLFVTDLVGVRVLHLHQTQFKSINTFFQAKIESGDWYLAEEAKAYTWDPESERFFKDLGLNCYLKESSYTSVHYIVRPKATSKIACEIQIRTLFEEVWGEVDHALNYPNPTEKLTCKEQLQVLAKVVGAGSRLVDSIFRA